VTCPEVEAELGSRIIACDPPPGVMFTGRCEQLPSGALIAVHRGQLSDRMYWQVISGNRVAWFAVLPESVMTTNAAIIAAWDYWQARASEVGL